MNTWTNKHVLQCWLLQCLCLVVLQFSVCCTWLSFSLLGLCITIYTEAAVKRCCLPAEPKLPNFEANFRQLLVRSRFNRPNEAIVNTVVRRLAARMIACSSVTQAADLYEDASCLPGASTAKHLMTQHRLTVNGPLYPWCEGRQNKFNIWLLGHARG